MAQNETDLKTSEEIFARAKFSLENIDPVFFCENNLTLDGRPFRIRKNGYKPFVEMYRYIGIKALTKQSKPIVLVKGRQVGATTMGVNLEMFFMGSGLFGVNGRPPMRIMHLYPMLESAKAYSKTKLNQTIVQSKPISVKNKTKGIMESLLSDNTGGDSVHFKEFVNGNHIWVESVGVNADRLRGRTADLMFFDEVQDMFKRAILNAEQLLKKSQYGPPGSGIKIYMGTPKDKDSMYYDIWINSTQNYFYLGCEYCGELFPLYTPESDDWEKIWLEGYYPKCDHCDKSFSEKKHNGFQVRCTKCKHIQDKRDAAEKGQWIGKPEDDCKYVGFHINVLYMPEYTRESIVAQKPGVSVTVDETAWKNEVLGEFYAGGGIVITSEEIRRNCADFDRKMRKIILPEECTNDRNVYLGCDWGKKVDVVNTKDGDSRQKKGSYSCVVILKVEGPELFTIQFATKLINNDEHYKLEFLEQAMMNYNVKAAVGDVGFAYDFMKKVNNTFGNNFVASEASGHQINGKAKFAGDDEPPTIRFEHDYYIEKMFKLFRAGAIRFPFRDWENIGWLVQHCTNMVAKPQADKHGNVIMRYSKGSIPNDGFMALINAYLAYEYDITNGYKVMKNTIPTEQMNKYRISAIGAHVPGMRITL